MLRWLPGSGSSCTDSAAVAARDEMFHGGWVVGEVCGACCAELVAGAEAVQDADGVDAVVPGCVDVVLTVADHHGAVEVGPVLLQGVPERDGLVDDLVRCSAVDGGEVLEQRGAAQRLFGEGLDLAVTTPRSIPWLLRRRRVSSIRG